MLPTEVALDTAAPRALGPDIVTIIEWMVRPLSERSLVLETDRTALAAALKALLTAILMSRLIKQAVVLVVGKLSASSRAELLWMMVILRLVEMMLFVPIPREEIALWIESWTHRVLIVLLQSSRVRLRESGSSYVVGYA